MAWPRGVKPWRGGGMFASSARRIEAEGESDSVRRPGSRRLRSRLPHGGGSRATLDPRSDRDRSPASGPGSRARCASAAWPCRRGLRSAWCEAASKASTWWAQPRSPATRSATTPGALAQRANNPDAMVTPARWQTARQDHPCCPRASARSSKPCAAELGRDRQPSKFWRLRLDAGASSSCRGRSMLGKAVSLP